MNRTKLLFVLVAAGLLAGCASNARVDALHKDVQAINTKVDGLADSINGLKQDVQAAKDDAARANMRLDNMARGYKK